MTTSNDPYAGETTDRDGLSNYNRLRSRTWIAAMPYLAGAAACWFAGVVVQLKVNDAFQGLPNAGAPVSAVRQAILQMLSTVTLFAGVVLFALGFLIAVLRQHERWRRDLDLALDDPTDEADFDGLVVSDGVDPEPDETPAYARSVWANDPPEPTGAR